MGRPYLVLVKFFTRYWIKKFRIFSIYGEFLKNLSLVIDMNEKIKNLSLVINTRLKSSPKRTGKEKILNMENLREILRTQELRMMKLFLFGSVIAIIGILIFTFTGIDTSYFTFFGMAILIIALVQLFKLENMIDRVNSEIRRSRFS